MPGESVWRSRSLVLAAAVLWSLSGVVLKAPAFDGLSPDARGPAVAGLRAVFAAMALLPFLRPSRIRWRPALVPMAFGFSAMSVLFVSALMATTVAAAIFLQYTSVVWACLLGWAVLRERPGRPDAVALAFVALGIGVILYHDRGSPVGNVLALASGVAYAGVVVSLRALRDEDPVWLSFLNQATGAALIVPWMVWIGVELTAAQVALIAFLGVVQLALPYVLFSHGVRHVSAGEASLLLLVEPILNPLWTLLVWGEQAAWTTWTGGVIILGGLVARFAWAAWRPPLPPAELRSAPSSEPTAAVAAAPPARPVRP